MMEKQLVIILRRETAAMSWLRNASSLALCIGLVGVGVLLNSSAMQWVGVLIWFLILVITASGLHKRNTHTIESAKTRIAEIEAEMNANDT